MSNRVVLFFIIFNISSLIFSSEFSDPILDRAMDAFVEKNYELALNQVESVLVVEPDNETALLYKKTIVDAIAQEEKKKNSSEKIEKTDVGNSISAEDEKDNKLDEDNRIKGDIFAISLYVANSDTDSTIELRNKLSLGIPILDLRFRSPNLGTNLLNTSFIDFPVDSLISFTNYMSDLSIGIRIIPFDYIGADLGYFDFKLGKNFSNEPYIGFDSEVFILNPYIDNWFTRSVWIGAGGSVSLNKFTYEVKAGLKLWNLTIGGFYSVDNYTNFGLLTSFSF